MACLTEDDDPLHASRVNDLQHSTILHLKLCTCALRTADRFPPFRHNHGEMELKVRHAREQHDDGVEDIAALTDAMHGASFHLCRQTCNDGPQLAACSGCRKSHDDHHVSSCICLMSHMSGHMIMSLVQRRRRPVRTHSGSLQQTVQSLTACGLTGSASCTTTGERCADVKRSHTCSSHRCTGKCYQLLVSHSQPVFAAANQPS